ncbi:MAG: hypothetical protein HOV81_24865 [Kofleriaceae bacterium]|nr:hypothetical protein [Kofleriaceae bacterium]
MSLALLGRNASYEFRWRRWALLRDTVEALLGPRFPTVASFGDVLTRGPRRIVASVLAQEVTDIVHLLGRHAIDKLMLGPQTAAVLYPRMTIARARPLTGLELEEVAPIGSAHSLGEYFASTCDSIEYVCRNPFIDGTVELVDM